MRLKVFKKNETIYRFGEKNNAINLFARIVNAKKRTIKLDNARKKTNTSILFNRMNKKKNYIHTHVPSVAVGTDF